MKIYDIMQYIFRVWMFAGLVCAVSCGVEDVDLPPETTVIETTPDDEADADTSGSDREYAEVEVCSVLIRFVFENGHGVEVQFENGNDATVIVSVDNDSTGGLVVENCLWPDNEDNETAVFGKGDQLAVSVYLGEGDLFQYTCSDLLGDVFGAFNFCDEMNILIQ